MLSKFIKNLLLIILLPVIGYGQDCGYFQFKVDYHLYPAIKFLKVDLVDRCTHFELIMNHNLGNNETIIYDTIMLENNAVQDFVRTIEHVNPDKLNSLVNKFISDGLIVKYMYISKQEYTVIEKIYFPTMNIESMIYLEDEMKVMNEFYKLYSNYFHDDHIDNYKIYFKTLMKFKK